MNKLLKLVFFRLRKEKAPWVELSIAIVLGLIVGCVYAYIGSSITTGDLVTVSVRNTILSTFSPTYNVPTALAIAGAVAFFHTEINYGTLRNQITSGYSRKQIFISYWIGVLALAGMILLAFLAADLFVSGWFLPLGFTASNVGPFFMSIGFGIIETIAMITLAYTLTHLIKSPVWPILICILYSGSSVIANQILQLIFVSSNPNPTADEFRTFFNFMVFLPTAQSAAITSGNYSSFHDGLVTNITDPTYDYTLIYVVAILGENILIFVASFFGGLFYFDRHDLK